jgi:hypothetical protein
MEYDDGPDRFSDDQDDGWLGDWNVLEYDHGAIAQYHLLCPRLRHDGGGYGLWE